MNRKQWLLVIFAILALHIPSRTFGFVYKDEDVLLIFHKDGANDVEFNLGSVSQFLNRSAGYEINVTGWDPALVQSVYDFSDDVKVLLLAATRSDAADRRVWVTSAEPLTPALDRTPSQWQLLQARISAIGLRPQESTQTNASNAYSDSPTLPSSFTYIASNRGSAVGLISRLGGDSVFKVEATVPTTLDFYEIHPSTLNPKPAAKKLGQFEIDATGKLVFRVPSALVPTQVSDIRRTDQGITLRFTSVAGSHYRLRTSARLDANLADWTPLATEVEGTGSELSLTDADAPTGSDHKFYVVETIP